MLLSLCFGKQKRTLLSNLLSSLGSNIMGESMSTTDGRRERMQRLLKLLKNHPEGLEPYEIAGETNLLEEITQDTLYKYLSNLHWAGTLIRLEGTRYALSQRAVKKLKRERERKRKKQIKEEEVKEAKP